MLESIRTLHILHLEDSPRDALLIQDCLEQGGVTADIELVNDRARFEDALAEKEWHLVLCDYNLPDYDGLAALQRVREKRPLTPVIILSGSISPEEAVTCMRAGATDYLMKQERSERLAAAVQRAIDEAAERRMRIAAEASLREKEERLRLAFVAAGMEAWDVDLRSGRIRLSQTAPRPFGRRGCAGRG